MMWFRRKPRVDTAAAERQADAAVQRITDQQPRVDALTSWLERRKNQNGFGDDFEYTLRPKEAP